jgi:predicted outer membrane repeat protein
MIICRENRKEEATYTIDNCYFEGNENAIIQLGGGLTLHFDSPNSTSFVNISKSMFVKNKAIQGGGIYVNEASDSDNTVNVSNTQFISNNAIGQGGGMWITNWVNSGAESSPLMVNLHYCFFTLNYAMWSGGLGSYVPAGNGHVKIAAYDSNWTRNGADTSGFAIGLEEADHYGTLFLVEATLINCWIRNHTMREFGWVGGATGALYANGAKVILKGNMEIAQNIGSAVLLRASSNLTLGGGYLVFHENEAARGGAIHLQSRSIIHLAPSDVMIVFDSNSAAIEGGAIYAELSESLPCLFDFVTSTNSTTNVWFVDNFADNFNQVGQSIFIRGGAPDCCFEEQDNGSWATPLQRSPFRYVPSRPNNVLFDIDEVDLDSIPPLEQTSDTKILTLMLGEHFALIPNIKDQLNHTTTGVAHVVLTYDNPVLDFSPNDSKFIYVGPNVMGLDGYTINNDLYIKGTNDTHDLILSKEIHNLILEIIFNKNENGYRDGYATITITLVPCRLGFVYDKVSNVCTCFSNKDHILCPNTSSACVRNGYWFGSLNDGTFDYLLCDKGWCDYLNQKCPTEQCSTSPDFCALHNDSDDLCFPGRGGILCSHCKEKYAFSFSSFLCVPEETCSGAHTFLMMLAVLLYWLLIILLLFLVLSMNFGVGTGFASGIIYYFSVVFLLTSTIVTSAPLRIILRICTALSQLDTSLFGEIPLCFAKSWDYNIYHNAFSYASPLFVGVTILAIVWCSRCCNCPRRISLAENSPNHAICLLILILYTSMTYTSFVILRPISIGGVTYVYSDPDIPYFHRSKHLPFALIAIFVELFFSLPICFLLLFAPCLSRIKRVNLVRLRLKPIIDEFQACYKDEHRWFAGFYFLARQLMYIANIIPHQVLPQSNSLLHCVCVFVLLVQTTVRPYKQEFWYLNIVDTILLTDLLLLALFPINSYLNITTYLPWLVRNIQMVSPYVLILVPSLYTSAVIGFLIYKRFFRWCKIKKPIEVVTDDDEDSLPKLREPSFFQDFGEREPLLSDTTITASDYSRETYSNDMRGRQRVTQSGFTTSSLRVENLERFPPPFAENNKSATS